MTPCYSNEASEYLLLDLGMLMSFNCLTGAFANIGAEYYKGLRAPRIAHAEIIHFK